jgi:hypothetical protein
MLRLHVHCPFLFFSETSTQFLGHSRFPMQRAERALFPEVKQLGCDADPSPPSSDQANYTWNFTATLPLDFMSFRLVTLLWHHTDIGSGRRLEYSAGHNSMFFITKKLAKALVFIQWRFTNFTDYQSVTAEEINVMNTELCKMWFTLMYCPTGSGAGKKQSVKIFGVHGRGQNLWPPERRWTSLLAATSFVRNVLRLSL